MAAHKGANVRSQVAAQHAPVIEFKKLFILGGPGDEDTWRQYFAPFGNIIRIQVLTDKKTERAKGMTYINYEKTSEAALAIENMQGQHIGGEKPIKVMFAQDKRDNLEIDVDEDKMIQRLFIKCPKTYSELDLTDHFGNFGNVEWCRILKEKSSGENRGLAFVKFSKQSEAAKALEEADASFKARWADVRVKSEEDGNQQVASNACYNCGQPGHYSRECPTQKGGKQGGGGGGGGGGHQYTTGDPYAQGAGGGGGGGYGGGGGGGNYGGGGGNYGGGGGGGNYGGSGGGYGGGGGGGFGGSGGGGGYGGSGGGGGYGGGGGGGYGSGGGGGGYGRDSGGYGGGMDYGFGGGYDNGNNFQDQGFPGAFGKQKEQALPDPTKEDVGPELVEALVPPSISEEQARVLFNIAPGLVDLSIVKVGPSTRDPLGIVESTVYADIGADNLEALLPETITHQQAYGLFDIAPGLDSLRYDKATSVAKVQYTSPKCAAYAKEKIDGLDYAGQKLAVRFGKIMGTGALKKTAVELQNTLAALTAKGGADPLELMKIMQSMSKVTDAIQNPASEENDSIGEEMVPWCSIPLPIRKPMSSSRAHIAARLFVVAVPDKFSDELLVNAFCRFGDLITVKFQPDKRFGFAHYASEEAAEAAKNTLHGQYVANNRLKIEYTEGPKLDRDGDGPQRKRGRDF